MAFKSSVLKPIPIIWLPQDICGESEKESNSSFFDEGSLHDISIASVEELPLWRQSEIRKNRFQKRQHRFNEKLPLQYHHHQIPKSDSKARRQGRRGALPHIVRHHNSANKSEADDELPNTAIFLPKLSDPKRTSPSFLSEVLKTSSLQPKATDKSNLKMPNAPRKYVFGRHYQLPAINKSTED